MFADGEDENNLKAVNCFQNSGLGIPILVAKEDLVKKKLTEIGYTENLDIEIVNSTDNEKRKKYTRLFVQKTSKRTGFVRERL